jgi:hypothetical protein
LTGNAAELRHGSFGVLSSMSTAGTDPFNRRHSLLQVAVDYFSKPLTMACYHCAVPLYRASRAFTVGGIFDVKAAIELQTAEHQCPRRALLASQGYHLNPS